MKRNCVSEGCQKGSQAPDALAFISADGMGFLDDSFINRKQVTDTKGKSIAKKGKKFH